MLLLGRRRRSCRGCRPGCAPLEGKRTDIGDQLWSVSVVRAFGQGGSDKTLNSDSRDETRRILHQAAEFHNAATTQSLRTFRGQRAILCVKSKSCPERRCEFVITPFSSSINPSSVGLSFYCPLARQTGGRGLKCGCLQPVRAMS